jgi:hypothetical protein
MTNSSSHPHGLTEAELNLYGLPYRSQAELQRQWELAELAAEDPPPGVGGSGSWWAHCNDLDEPETGH